MTFSRFNLLLNSLKKTIIRSNVSFREWFGEWASARYCESLMELLRQRFRIVQSTGIEAFREPIMGRGERVGRTHFVVLVHLHGADVTKRDIHILELLVVDAIPEHFIPSKHFTGRLVSGL